MKKAIIKRKSEYEMGSYIITGAGKWNGVIYDYQKNAIIKDIKEDGYVVYENDWKTEEKNGVWKRKEILIKL